MKKVMYIAIISAMILLQASCGGMAKKAMEQAKLSMASSDYKTALNSLQLAKQEGSKDKEIDEMISVLENYISAKDAFDKGDMEAAADAMAEIPESYTSYTISGDVEYLKKAISEKVAIISDVDSQIAGVRNMIASGDYESADINITELFSKELTGEQKKQVDELKATLDTAKAKIDEASMNITSNTNVVATYYVVNCNENITLRSEPSTSASSLAKIPLGQAVGYIENVGNGFYKVNYDGAVGYALASYLSETKTTNTLAMVVNAKEYITLRSDASTLASEITKIPANSYVTYLGSASNGFCRVEYNGMQGYCLMSYIEIQ